MSRGERKALIGRDQPELSLSRQCEILAISRSSFYYTPKGESLANLALMRRIDELFLKYPFYGSRQMVRQLRRDGVRTGRHRVRRLMRLMGLQAIYPAPRTSDPHPSHRVYPYLLKGMTIDRPNQVWCADITYIPVQRGFLYLVAIMDWATRHVLAWRLSNTMDAGFCVEALQEALARYGRPKIFNTDQGQPVYQLRVHRCSQGRGCRDLDGWSGPVHGQYLHRTSMALAQIRGGLPARVERWLRGAAGHRRLDRLLQHRTAPFRPGRPNAGRGLRRRAACGYDGQGYRLAHIPTGSTAATGRDKQKYGSMIRQRNTP